MKNLELKFSLFLEVINPDDIDFYVDGAEHTTTLDTGVLEYVGQHNPLQVTRVSVVLRAKRNPLAALVVKEINVSGTPLTNLDKHTTYSLDSGTPIEYTHGYIGFPGTYTVKIRYSPVVHNYIGFFLSCSSHTALT